VVTAPGLGVFVMMGEDMIDRYFIIPLENRTANPYLILVARSLGNPARSFANLMAFKEGWTRETRPGIFGENHQRRKELVKEYKEGLISAPFGPHTAEERALMNKTVERPPSKESTVELNAYGVYESLPGWRKLHRGRWARGGTNQTFLANRERSERLPGHQYAEEPKWRLDHVRRRAALDAACGASLLALR